jgi:hypothetical protein
VEDAQKLQRLLTPAADAVGAGPESTGSLANISFQVPQDSAEEFLAAAEEARKSHPHLDVRVNGPLPPYSFVEPGPAEPAASTATG